jgi:hypothetical protein
MNNRTTIKRFILAGIFAITLLLGTLDGTAKIQASNSSRELAGTMSTCWKCN